MQGALQLLPLRCDGSFAKRFVATRTPDADPQARDRHCQLALRGTGSPLTPARLPVHRQHMALYSLLKLAALCALFHEAAALPLQVG